MNTCAYIEKIQKNPGKNIVLFHSFCIPGNANQYCKIEKAVVIC